jgi:hypothetical protein
MGQVSAQFDELLQLRDLVEHHEFNHGNDQGPYFNFTFGTKRAGELWREIQGRLYGGGELADHMRRASMAMCSSEEGWDDYLLLFHYDPKVELDDATAL